RQRRQVSRPLRTADGRSQTGQRQAPACRIASRQRRAAIHPSKLRGGNLMADDIHYDYHTIEQALDDINQQIRSANTLKADVADIFNKMQPHYEGEAGRELQAQHRLIDGKMEELLADL